MLVERVRGKRRGGWKTSWWLLEHFTEKRSPAFTRSQTQRLSVLDLKLFSDYFAVSFMVVSCVGGGRGRDRFTICTRFLSHSRRQSQRRQVWACIS